MADEHYGYWQTEYDWKIAALEQSSESDLRENVLCILFEAGAQRLFSSVRIALCCNHKVSENVRDAWAIRVIPNMVSSSESSLTNCASIEPRSEHMGSNTCSLPTYSLIFVANHVPSLDPPRVHGSLQLYDMGSLDASVHTFFEVVQPLTEETQSVSVIFTSSRWISILIPRAHFRRFRPKVDLSASAGRVVRVFPSLPTRNRRSITLPTDVLLIVFENIFDPTNAYWRRDLVSCGLVCRRWTCALAGEFLFSDFRSGSFQEGYPPEISSLAAALVAQPHHGRFIHHLSSAYFQRHSTRIHDPDDSDPTPLEGHLQLPMMHRERFSRFTNALVSILHSATNVQTLRLDRIPQAISLYDLLQKFPASLAPKALVIGEVHGMIDRNPSPSSQILSCIAKWASLERLTFSYIQYPDDDHDDENIPLEPMMPRLAELNLSSTSIRDNGLIYLISSSSSSLQQLTMQHTLNLTNTGISSALHLVSRSLTYLRIVEQRFALDEGEEYALDSVVSHMEHLERLEITPGVASRLMIERRALAFESSAGHVLPEINLKISVFPSQDNEIIVAAGMNWPGWKITVDLRH